MQILTTRYNFKFRKLTFYGITRPQSIRKSKQISGQTILSSLQDTEFNPIFAKNRDIRMVKNSVTRPVTPVLPKERPSVDIPGGVQNEKTENPQTLSEYRSR